MGRQVFTAGEILTAANMNDLSDQSVMVFDDASARTTAIPTPVEGMVTYLSDEDEVQVFDGSAFKAVGPGKILQVVSTVKTDAFSTAGTAFQAVTGLSATITPSSASSKVFVMLDANVSGPVGVSSVAVQFRLTGGNSDTYVGDSSGTRVRAIGGFGASGTSNSEFQFGERSLMPATGMFLDSPATTSATTYQMEMKVSTSTAHLNRTGSAGDGASYTRGASSLTLMEVAG